MIRNEVSAQEAWEIENSSFTSDADGDITFHGAAGHKVPHLTPIQAHDEYGMTLSDCLMCQAGESQIHRFEWDENSV